MVLAVRQGTDIRVVAKASGVLPRPATILDGEVFAIHKALKLCEADVDITTDSKVAVKQQSAKTPGRKWRDRLRAKLAWVKAHLDQKAFEAKHGASELWRWRLNIAADELAGQRADKAVASDAVAQVRRADHLISTLSQYLSQKAEILLTTQDKKDLFRKREAKPKSFNKRRQIEALVEPGANVLEHNWELGSKHPLSLTARCAKCGLWQVDPPSLFQQTLAQPCLGQPGSPPDHFGLHESHCWVSTGVGWQCKGCERIIKARAKKVPPALQQHCRTRQANNKTTAATRSLLQGLAVPGRINHTKNRGSQAAKSQGQTGHITSFFAPPPGQEPFPAKAPQVEEEPRHQPPQSARALGSPQRSTPLGGLSVGGRLRIPPDRDEDTIPKGRAPGTRRRRCLAARPKNS